jgi:cytochrome c oxidase assembly protein subunit 15
MNSSNKAVSTWLIIVCVTIFLMIVVGGVTRLTHSGLSMVDWKPIMGFIPPIGDAEWQDTFEAYQQFPEYQLVNKGMDLQAFKSIFYWEYGHRVLGRSIGVIFFLPMIVLWLFGKIDAKLMPRLVVGLVLGGLQGLMGWYMVMSGLVDIPRVSHYRLAAHLSLALIILCYLYWIILDLYSVRRFQMPSLFRKLASVVVGLVSLQIIYGAFTAGLRAGLGYNTFPLMDGKLIAEAATMMSPLWLNFFENGAMIQFVHRWVGTLLLVSVAGLFGMAMGKKLPRPIVSASLVLVTLVVAQYLLGILTLINYVPVFLGSLHQAVACLVLLGSVHLVYIVRDVSGVSLNKLESTTKEAVD